MVGILELRKVICEFYGEFDGINVKLENVIVGLGFKELIFFFFSVFSGDVFVLFFMWIIFKL